MVRIASALNYDIGVPIFRAGSYLPSMLWRSPTRRPPGSCLPTLARTVPGIQLSDHIDSADGEALFRNACAMSLEDIVAKRRDKLYRSGRSPDWIKVKNPDAPAATRVIEG